MVLCASWLITVHVAFNQLFPFKNFNILVDNSDQISERLGLEKKSFVVRIIVILSDVISYVLQEDITYPPALPPRSCTAPILS